MSSTYVDATVSATEHLDAMAAMYPDLASAYSSMSSLLSRKLYHQLTLAILALVSDMTLVRSTADGTHSFLALYDRVILPLDKKLNPLSLARIASAVSKALSLSDPLAAKAILENVSSRTDSLLGPMEKVYLQSKLNLLIMEQQTLNGVLDTVAFEEIKAILKRNRTILVEFSTSSRNTITDEADVDTTVTSTVANANLTHAITDTDASLVQSAFYECAMMYRKCVGPPEEYYKEAMQYLHYTPLETLTPEQKYGLATDLCLAALIGDGVYNLGDLLVEPIGATSTSILASLIQTDKEWLLHVLQAAASGHVETFQQTTQRYASQMASHPLLVSKSQAVYEKVTLLALIQTLFEKPSKDKTFTFEEIAQAIQMKESQVEYVLIRAMSLGLIQGWMDQVDGKVEISWVIPRTLNKQQVENMKNRLDQWSTSIVPVDQLLSLHNLK